MKVFVQGQSAALVSGSKGLTLPLGSGGMVSYDTRQPSGGEGGIRKQHTVFFSGAHTKLEFVLRKRL